MTPRLPPVARLGLLLVVTICCHSPPRRLLAAPPVLSTATPRAVPPGECEVVLRGQNLPLAGSPWVSAGEVEPLEKSAAGEARSDKVLPLRLRLPADAAGSLGLILGAAEGASNVLVLPIDDLPSVAESGAHQTPDAAQPLPFPSAVDATFDAAAADYFRCEVTAGQRISIEVLGGRLGGDCDPLLRVLDADGKELAEADDDELLGPDPRLELIAPGPIVLELRDSRYRGGVAYRVRVGDFPLATTSSPPVVGVEASEVAVATSGESPPTHRLDLSHSADAPWSPSRAHVWGAPGSAGSTAIVTWSWPGRALIESSSPAEAAEGPWGFAGRLSVPGERDRIRLRATAGTTMRFRGHATSVGAPGRLRLRLHQGDKILASSDPTQEEPQLDHKFAADGDYELEVTELLGQGGAGQVYFVEALVRECRWSLVQDKATKLSAVVPAADGAWAFNVRTERLGTDAPLRLAADLPGLRVYPRHLPAQPPQSTIVVAPPVDAPAGWLGVTRLRGEADGEVHTLSTREALVAERPLAGAPPPWLDGLLRLAVAAPVEAKLFTAQVTTPPVRAADGAISFAITVEGRANDFKDPVQLFGGLLASPEGAERDYTWEAKADKDVWQVTLREPSGAAGAVRVALFGQLKERGQLLELDVALPEWRRPPLESLDGEAP